MRSTPVGHSTIPCGTDVTHCYSQSRDSHRDERGVCEDQILCLKVELNASDSNCGSHSP